VQIIIAGKAHPKDDEGKDLIRRIIHFSRLPEIKGQVVFVEDYDQSVARYMLQGVDVWLNTPRRPLEASGTSGMKAAANGAVNLSVLDGWWDEAWTGTNGWAIGGRTTNPDEGAQDWADAQDLYRLIEQEVVPLYYDRDVDDLPLGWTDLMRRSIGTTIWQFSTTRMLQQYIEEMYLPAAGGSVARAAGEARGGAPMSAASPRS
jgi:glycogen phosphorylase